MDEKDVLGASVQFKQKPFQMKKLLSLLTVIPLLLAGCESTLKYPPSTNWSAGTKILGPVEADSGMWSLSLSAPPPEYTYFAALRDKAAFKFNVPTESVAIGEMTVSIGAEMDGTVRDWHASAIAGQNTNSIPK
jgi:hypothetical protein